MGGRKPAANASPWCRVQFPDGTTTFPLPREGTCCFTYPRNPDPLGAVGRIELGRIGLEAAPSRCCQHLRLLITLPEMILSLLRMLL